MFDKEYYNTLPNGTQSVEYLKKCIAEADNEKNYEDMLTLREEYLDQSFMHGDGFKGLMIFPEYMTLFDEHPGIISPRIFMFNFKWVLGNSSDFYQISREQTDKYFELFKQYIEKFGYTMRTYYLFKACLQRDMGGNDDEVIELMNKGREYERTEMSDCETCEMSSFIENELLCGSFEKGLGLLREMTERGMRCAEQPQCTYSFVAREFAKRGIYDEAKHYADLALPPIKREFEAYINGIAYLLTVYTLTDLNQAYELFRSTAHYYTLCKNPSEKLNYADAAARFFRKLEEEGETDLTTNLNSSFERFDDSGEYKISELREFFEQQAEDLAGKFDSRNGNSLRSQQLEFVYPDSPVTKLDLPMHGKVTRQPYAYAIPFTAPENFPDPDTIKSVFENTGEYDYIDLRFNKETNMLMAGGRDTDGNPYEYHFMFNDMMPLNGLEQYHYLPSGIEQDLEAFTCMMIIVSVPQDTFRDMRKLVKLTSAFNKDSSPVILDLTTNRILSSVWADIEAKGSTAPYERYLFRLLNYRTAFEDMFDDDALRGDIVTSGLTSFGSRELIVPAVKEDDIEFVRSVISQVAEGCISVRSLPDEGIKFNTGIIFTEKNDGKSLVKNVLVSWSPLTIPIENDEGEETEIPQVFAELKLHMPDGRVIRPDELTEDERENINFYTSNRSSDISAQKARETFTEAREFFLRNQEDFWMLAGVEVTLPDPEYDDEEYEDNLFLEVRPDGKYIVLSDEYEENGIKKGDEFAFDPEKLFMWRLDVGEDRLGPDDLCFLLTKEKELYETDTPDEEN